MVAEIGASVASSLTHSYLRCELPFGRRLYISIVHGYLRVFVQTCEALHMWSGCDDAQRCTREHCALASRSVLSMTRVTSGALYSRPYECWSVSI